MPEQGKLIWENNYIEIPNNASDKLIRKTILNALRNKTHLLKISESMSKKILEEYNYSAYAKKLYDICATVENSSSGLTLKNDSL
jgi:hypothetical protein